MLSSIEYQDGLVAMNATLTEARGLLLQQVLDIARDELTRGKIRNFYRRVDRIVAACALGRPLED